MTQLGADQYIDLDQEPFEDVAGQVDVVFDLIGHDIFRRSWAVVKPGGTLVSAVEVPLAAVPGRPEVQRVFFVVVPSRAELVELAKQVERCDLRPVIGGVVPLADGSAAFEAKHARGVPGKMVQAVMDPSGQTGARQVEGIGCRPLLRRRAKSTACRAGRPCTDGIKADAWLQSPAPVERRGGVLIPRDSPMDLLITAEAGWANLSAQGPVVLVIGRSAMVQPKGLPLTRVALAD